MVHLHAQGTPEGAAVVLTELDRLTDEIFHERRTLGVREARDTYVWDALVRISTELLGEATLKLIITRGVDVLNVTSLGRGPTAAMRHALLWSSPTCTVEGCSRTIVEHDHRTGAEYKHTRHTRLDELDPVCGGHHDLHTHHGWALVHGKGKRAMVPPDDPRHPARGLPCGTAARAGPSP